MDSLNFDDLIPSDQSSPSQGGGSVSFDDLVPQQAQQAIPMPPRRPVELGGQPEPQAAIPVAPPAPAPAPVQAPTPERTMSYDGMGNPTGYEEEAPKIDPNAPLMPAPIKRFVNAASRSFAGSVSDTASGADVLAKVMGKDVPQSVKDFAKATGDYADDPSRKGDFNSMGDVHSASDFGNYLLERMGDTLGGLGGFVGADIAVGAGTTAVAGPVAGGAASLGTVFGLSTLQGIGATNKALLAEPDIQKLIKDGKLTEEDIARTSLVPGVIDGIVTTGMIKLAGGESPITGSIVKDITKIIVKDPAIFASGAGAQDIVSQLATSYAKGDSKLQVDLQKTFSAAINGAFGGLIFSGAKAVSRLTSEKAPASDESAALKGEAVDTNTKPAETKPQEATIRDEGGDFDGVKVQIDPDQTGVKSNVAVRVILPNGQKHTLGNRLLEPAEAPEAPATTAQTQPNELSPDAAQAAALTGSETPSGDRFAAAREKFKSLKKEEPVQEQAPVTSESKPEQTDEAVLPSKREPMSLQEQQAALANGEIPMVLYPEGTKPLKKPDDPHIRSYTIPDVGVIHYDDVQFKAKDIRKKIADGSLEDHFVPIKGEEAPAPAPTPAPVAEAPAPAPAPASAPAPVAEAPAPAPEAPAAAPQSPAAEATAKLDQVIQAQTARKEEPAPAPAPVQPPISIDEVRKLLPKDANGSPDWASLTTAIEKVAGPGKALKDITPEQGAAVMDELRKSAPAPEAPAAVTPEVTPKPNEPSKALKARTAGAKRSKAAQAVEALDQAKAEREQPAAEALAPEAPAPEAPKALEARKAGAKRSRAAQAADDLKAQEDRKATEAKEPEAKTEETPVPETKPTAEPTGRVLYPKGESAGIPLGQVDLDELNPEARRNFMEQMGEAYEVGEAAPKESKGRGWTKKEIAARAENNEKARKVIEQFKPDEQAEKSYLNDAEEGGQNSEAVGQARQAILDRAKAMIDQADTDGVKIPPRPGRGAKNINEDMRHDGSVFVLAEARALLKMKNPKEDDFNRFVTREKALLGGDVEGVVEDRKVEGDEKLRGKQKSVEDIAAAPAAVTSADTDVPTQTTVAQSSRMGVRGLNDASEERTVLGKDGKPIQVEGTKAASEGQSRQDLLAEYAQKYAHLLSKDKVLYGSWDEFADDMFGKRDTNNKVVNEHRGEAAFAIKSGTVEQFASAIKPEFFPEGVDALGRGIAATDVMREVQLPMLETLVKTVKDVPVYILPDDAYDMFAPKSGGYYAPGRDIIVLPESSVQEPMAFSHVMTHEAAHAGLMHAMASNTKLREDMGSLFEHAKDLARNFADEYQARGASQLSEDALLFPEIRKGDKAYAFRNIDEFVSELWGNPDFKAWLKSKPLPKELSATLPVTLRERITTLLDYAKAKLTEVLLGYGVKMPKRSLFDAAMHVSEQLLKDAPTARREFYDWLGENGTSNREDAGSRLYAPKQERTLEEEFAKRGVSPEDAKGLSDTMREVLGDKIDLKDKAVRDMISDVSKEFYRAKPEAKATGEKATPESNAPGAKGAKIKELSKARQMFERFRKNNMNIQQPLETARTQVEGALGRELPENAKFDEINRLKNRKSEQLERKVMVEASQKLSALDKKARALGFDPKEFDNALIARHAPAANKYLLEKEGVEDGSNMSNAKAKEVMKGINADAAKKAMFDEYVKLNDALRDREHETQLFYGTNNKGGVDSFKKMFPEYTSLAGFADDAIAEGTHGSGMIGRKATSLIGKETISSKGRTSDSDRPIYNMAQNVARAIRRGENNRVGQALEKAAKEAGFTKNDKDSPFYVVGSVAGHDIGNIFKARMDPNVIGYKANGEQRFIVTRDPEIANVIDRVSYDELPGLMNGLLKVTRVLKGFFTYWRPDFMLKHYTRFLQEGGVNLQALAKYGISTNPVTFASNVMSLHADVVRYLQTGLDAVKDKTTRRYLEMMADAGAVTRFSHDDIRTREDFIKLADAPVKSRAKAALDLYMNMSHAGDLAQRLEAFKRVYDETNSTQRAAIAARDILPDPERRGRWAPYQTLYSAFSGIAINTAETTFRNLATAPRYRKIVAGMVLGSGAVSLANYYLGGKDKDGKWRYDKVPEWVKRTNMVFMTPYDHADGSPVYLMLPLSPAHYVWKALGDTVVDAAMKITGDGKKDTHDIAKNMYAATAESLTPFGHSSENPLNMIAPEPLRPVMELMSNRNAFDKPIYTERPRAGLPKSEQGYASTGEGYKIAADVMSKVGIDAYPEVYRHLFSSTIGSPVKSLTDIGKSVVKLGQGDFSGAVENPFSQVFVGKTPPAGGEAKNTYYKAVNKVDLPKDDLDIIRSAAAGKRLDSGDKERLHELEDHAGLKAKQLGEIIKMKSKMRSEQRKDGFDKDKFIQRESEVLTKMGIE